MNLLDVQTRLTLLGLSSGAADGTPGPLTDAGIEALFLHQHLGGYARWSRARRTVAAEQLICRMDGIDPGRIDGLAGPQTDHARQIWDARAATGKTAGVELWRDAPERVPAPAPAAAPTWMPRQTQAEVERHYGPIGKNQTTLILPYAMRIAWDTRTKVTKITCHEKVHDALRRALANVADAYGERLGPLGLDLFGGCLNVRRMRGGSAWSMHAWGIAIDIDPARNQLTWHRDRAQMAQPEYVRFVDLMQAEGALSLGRARDYDWMHFQFARF